MTHIIDPEATRIAAVVREHADAFHSRGTVDPDSAKRIAEVFASRPVDEHRDAQASAETLTDDTDNQLVLEPDNEPPAPAPATRPRHRVDWAVVGLALLVAGPLVIEVVVLGWRAVAAAVGGSLLFGLAAIGVAAIVGDLVEQYRDRGRARR